MNCPNCDAEMMANYPVVKGSEPGTKDVLYLCPDCGHPETVTVKDAKAVRCGSRSQIVQDVMDMKKELVDNNTGDRAFQQYSEMEADAERLLRVESRPQTALPPPILHEHQGKIHQFIDNVPSERAKHALIELGWRPPTKSLKALGIYVGASGTEYHCKNATMPDANYYSPEELEAIAVAERLRRTKED